MRAWILGFAVFIATEASVAAVSREPAFDETELLAGLALNLAAYDVDVPTRDQVFALDEEMRTFIAPVKAFRTPQQKMQALIRGLEEHGMFSLDYAEITRTATSSSPARDVAHVTARRPASTAAIANTGHAVSR